ncbi:DENN domain-containing protein 3-like [Sycon ciliatum]|uniref:DENN domain-containing protein 3-like n=1 Tax=Sycon ciliatum TaxID=27933 RepID=UPI0031F65ADC
MKPPDFTHLRNSLVKIGVIVGLDESTPLRLLDKECGDFQFLSPASCKYEEQLLFAVSGNVAACTTGNAPSNEASSNGDDAASARTNGGSGNREEAEAVAPFSDLYSCSAAAVPPVRQCWIRSDSCESVRAMPTEKPAMPIDWDIIGTLGTFCCPDGVSLSESHKDAHCHGLVLTDLTGVRTYGSCLTFYRPFQLIKNVDSAPATQGSVTSNSKVVPHRLRPCEGGKGDKSAGPVYYIQTCVCLVSESPYHTLLKDCLSGLLPQLESSSTSRDLQLCLSEFIAHAALIMASPRGPLRISFESSGHTHCCPAADFGRPIQDMRLNYPFSFFDKASIVRLITCLLTEQRIIFISSSPAACVLVMECLLSYILPFEWRQHYVPILPRRLIGLTEAPGQYLMGVHPDLLHLVEEDDDIVFADLDTGIVKIHDSIKLPVLPEAAAESFAHRLHDRTWDFDRISDRPSYGSFEEEKAARTKHQDAINSEIQEACFLLLANLFASMDDFVTSDGKRLQFNKAQFIKKIPDHEQPFYRQVCNSTMFSFFQEDRTQGRSDYFWKNIPSWRRVSRRHASRLSTRGSLSEPDMGGSPVLTQRNPAHAMSLRRAAHVVETTQILTLPQFDRTRHSSPSAYYHECIVIVSDRIEALIRTGASQADSTTYLPNLHSAYRYVRGMLYDACGQVSEALHDFDEMINMFPKSVARSLFSQLSEEEREAFSAAHPAFGRKIEGHKDERYQPTIDPLKTPIDNMKFPLVMKQLGLLDNPDASGSLFRVLQKKPGHSLPPATVKSLFHEWQEFAAFVNLNDAALPSDPVEVDLYTSSGVVRSSEGLGRLVLTTRSLIIIINERRHRLADLHTTSRVEKYRLRERFSVLSVSALRFIKTGVEVSQAPYVCLKEDRDLWYDIVTEMMEGIKCSEVRNYSQIIKFAAQNILMYIALSRLHYPASAESGMPLDKTTRAMLHYTSLKLPVVPPDVGIALMQRFNPSEQDATEATVECLQYVPALSSYDDDCGRLWCGMGSTKCAKILNAETFQLEFDVRCDDRVSALLRVGSHVWIGCLDNSITVVEADNGQALCRLLEHEAMIMCLVLGSNGMVWSASFNGQVIMWDPRRLTLAQRVILPGKPQVNGLVVYDGWVWCGSQRKLILINESNPEEQKVIEIGSSIRITSLAVSSVGELWAGGSRSEDVHIVDGKTHQIKDKVTIANRDAETGGSGIYALMAVNDKMWAGGKNGYVYIYDAVTKERIKEVKAHNDGVRSMCMIKEYVVTGPGSHDGVVAMWNPSVWNV